VVKVSDDVPGKKKAGKIIRIAKIVSSIGRRFYV
jgi:hypothetical protein